MSLLSDEGGHTDAVKLLDDAQESVRWEAQRRERRNRRVVYGAVASSTVLSILAITVIVLVLLPVLSRQTDDVARAVSAQVGTQVVLDARQARIDTGRAELTRANGRLAARGLPIVPSPGPTASGDALLVQAARANVLADLPDPIVADLRAQLDGAPTLPSSLNTVPGEDGNPGDSVVTGILPAAPDSPAAPAERAPRGQGGSSSGGSPSPGRTTRAPVAPPRPAQPQPAPQTTTPGRGLLPLLPGLPIRIPLLSS